MRNSTLNTLKPLAILAINYKQRISYYVQRIQKLLNKDRIKTNVKKRLLVIKVKNASFNFQSNLRLSLLSHFAENSLGISLWHRHTTIFKTRRKIQSIAFFLFFLSHDQNEIFQIFSGSPLNPRLTVLLFKMALLFLIFLS